MIARVWSAVATPANLQRYREHFEAHVLPELRSVDGYLGAAVLSSGIQEIEIIVSTRWRSLDVIRGFAGDDIERAVVHEAAKALLISWDERVRHHDVIVTDPA
jgi:heme-degrading monooxygenase HmoA